MKKMILWTVMALAVLVSCKSPTDDSGDEPDKPPSLTIRNESSYVLTRVTFSAVVFSAPGSTELPPTAQAVKQLAREDIDKGGYITFVRKDIGIECRVYATFTRTGDDYDFVFKDTTQVEERANTDNKKTLAQITFVSRLTVERGGLNIPRNDTVNLGELVVNSASPKQAEFVLKNTGVGKLLLNGSEPVKISGAEADGVFQVIQPESSEIAPKGSLSFKINFSPQEVQTFRATVTVNSNDPGGDFDFIISASGVSPKPVIEVFHDTAEVPQNGTVDLGDVIITRSKTIDLTVKNTGTQVLNINSAGITISGDAAALFSLVSSPSSNISAGGQSVFILRFSPDGAGEKQAVITIPNNDASRPNAVFLVQGNGKREYPVIELKSEGLVIPDEGEIDFGKVELGVTKTVSFTLNNTGPVDLVLTGSPVLAVSSSQAFALVAQPSKTTIENGDPVSFTVQFTPATEEPFEAVIGILVNAQKDYFSIKLKGNGYVRRPQIQVKYGTTVISPGNGTISFGRVPKDGSKTLNFTIKNTGDAALTLTGTPAVSITGVDAASFGVTQQPNVNLAPDAETIFTVRYAPTVDKVYEAQVNIPSISRDANPFVFTVAGTVGNPPSLTWSGPWIKQSENGTMYTSNALTAGNISWETLTINSTAGCTVVVGLTASCYYSNSGYASKLDGGKSTSSCQLAVSGDASGAYLYIVPPGTHYLYFGYDRTSSKSMGKENITVEAYLYSLY